MSIFYKQDCYELVVVEKTYHIKSIRSIDKTFWFQADDLSN